MQAAQHKKVVRLYRSLMKLSTKFPESEIAWEHNRVPMSDELRVEIRSSFRQHAAERDPEVVNRRVVEGERLKKMLEVILQNAFRRMYPTVRDYEAWGGMKKRDLLTLKEQ
eukprot:Rhum_TRINITY_DN16541_c0_g1::Rhum_TRINITY_DN16541_c0_g1_i1::g.163390::m.163390